MLNCSGDPLENYLKPFGFSVVLLPRANIAPLQLAVIKSSRRLEIIGDMASVFSANSVPLPDVGSDTALNLSGARSGSLNVGVGLKLLSGAFAAIGVPPLGLSAGFSSAAKISFAFDKVSIDSANFVDLDRFLADASLIGNAPSVQAMLEADSVYAILAVLRAKTVIISAQDENGRDAAIDLPGIKDVIGANVSIKSNATQSSRLELTSPVPLAFGIKAVQVFVANGSVSTLRPIDAGAVSLEANALWSPNPNPIPLDPDAIMGG